MMAHLKNSDWTQILPTINNKQKLVKYVNVFEKSKQLDRASVQQKPSEATNQNVASHAVNNVHSGTTLQAVPTLKVAQSVPSPRTDKRRNAIYRPRAKVNSVCFDKKMIPKKLRLTISSNQLLYQCKQRNQLRQLQQLL